MVNNLVFIMEMHQPYRLKKEDLINISTRDLSELFDYELDSYVLNRVAERSYVPVLNIIRERFEEIYERYGRKFSIGISMSGTLIEQLLAHKPEIIDLLKDLVSKDFIEIIVEPYYHSLASEISRREFEEQIIKMREKIRELFNKEPVGYINTELIYRDEIGCWLKDLGAEYTIIEGVERHLGGEVPDIYVNSCDLPILARHYRLSDDIAFRFSMKTWDQYPLTAYKYAEWIRRSPGDFVVVYIDFETFGEHHPRETGILDFLSYLPIELASRGVDMISPSNILSKLKPVRKIFIDEPISWADERKDLSAWLGNDLQKTAFELYKWAGSLVDTSDEFLKEYWRLLGEADHFHYMYYEPGSSFLVHDYFSYHDDPRKAFLSYMKALTIFVSVARERVKRRKR
jgi:alpha-amylase